MSYDDVQGRRTYSFGAIDFGAGDTTLGIDTPAGKRGRVVGIHVSVTETFTDDTTEGAVQVGVSGTLTEFANMAMGTTAAGLGLDSSNVSGSINNVEIETADAVVVTCLAPTGGTPAGIGYVDVTIQWY